MTNPLHHQYSLLLPLPPPHLFKQSLYSLSVLVTLCPRISSIRVLSDLVLDARRLQLFLILAHPRNLGVRVHNRGDGIVVDVPVAVLDHFHRGDTLLLGLVRQHGTERDVADTLDALGGSVELIVDDDSAALVGFDADLFEAEALGDGTTANGDEDDVGFELYCQSDPGWPGRVSRQAVLPD